MSWMFIRDKKNDNTSKNSKKQPIKEY